MFKRPKTNVGKVRDCPRCGKPTPVRAGLFRCDDCAYSFVPPDEVNMDRWRYGEQTPTEIRSETYDD